MLNNIPDHAQFEADKRAVYKHPLFSLLAFLLEKCENATQGNISSKTENKDSPSNKVIVSTDNSSIDDINAFVKLLEKEKRPLLTNNSELDNLMIKALQVLRIHLLELEKVQELCKDFCNRYIACLRGKMQSENLLRSNYISDVDSDVLLDRDNGLLNTHVNDMFEFPTISKNNFTQSVTENNLTGSDTNVNGENIKEKIDYKLDMFNETELENTINPKCMDLNDERYGIIDNFSDNSAEDSLDEIDSEFESNGDLTSNNSTSSYKSKRCILSKHATGILKAWLFQHLMHPYPTDEEKRMMATQTHLTMIQVSNWFINARRRILNPMLEEVNDVVGTKEALSLKDNIESV